MAFIEWKPSFVIGVGIIDEQHQELFRRVNELMTSMSDGRGREKVVGVVDFLEAYARTHFADEQAEMARARYPALGHHVKEHEVFVAAVTEIRRELAQVGSTASLTIAVNNRVCRWLVEHVLRSDRAFGDFFKKHQAESLAVRSGA